MTDQKPDFRLDHTMIRVFDHEKTIDFYTRILGMKLLRQNDYPDGRFTNTFGNAWGHFALKVTDVYATADYLKSQGVEFTREPGPMKGGTRLIAFFKDPNGYVIELNEPLAAAG